MKTKKNNRKNHINWVNKIKQIQNPIKLEDKFIILLSCNKEYIHLAKNTILSLIRFHPNVDVHLNLMDIKNVDKIMEEFLELYHNITFSYINFNYGSKTIKKQILSCLKDKPGWRNVVCIENNCETQKYKDLSPEKLKQRENEFKKKKSGYYVNFFSIIVHELLNKTNKNILKLDCGLLINRKIDDMFKNIIENDIFLVNSKKYYIDKSIPNNDNCYYKIIKQSFPNKSIDKSKIDNDKMMGSLLGVNNNKNGKLFCKTFYNLNNKFNNADWFNDQILLNVCYNYFLQKSNMKFYIGPFTKYLNWLWDSNHNPYILSGKGNRKRSDIYKEYISKIDNNLLNQVNSISFCILSVEFKISRLNNLIKSIKSQNIPNYEIIICVNNTYVSPENQKYIDKNNIKLISVKNDIRFDNIKKIKSDFPILINYASWGDRHLCWQIDPRINAQGVGDYVKVKYKGKEHIGKIISRKGGRDARIEGAFSQKIKKKGRKPKRKYNLLLNNGDILENIDRIDITASKKMTQRLSWRNKWNSNNKKSINIEEESPFVSNFINQINIYRKRRKLAETAKYDTVVCIKDYVYLDENWYKNLRYYANENKIDILTNKIRVMPGNKRYLDWIAGYKQHYSGYRRQIYIVPYKYSDSEFVDKFNIYGVGCFSLFNQNLYKGIDFSEYLFEKNLKNLKKVTFSNGETYNVISDKNINDKNIQNYITVGLSELYNIIPVVTKNANYSINKLSKCYIDPNIKGTARKKTSKRKPNLNLRKSMDKFYQKKSEHR
jgi:hypothetical protein